MIEKHWVNDNGIHELVPELTIACTVCKLPARAPEDIIAVLVEPDGSQHVVAVCPDCVPGVVESIKQHVRRDAEA